MLPPNTALGFTLALRALTCLGGRAHLQALMVQGESSTRLDVQGQCEPPHSLTPPVSHSRLGMAVLGFASEEHPDKS